MFFILDLMIAASVPALVYWLARSGRAPSYIVPLMWWGVAIGATWEFGYHFTGPEYWENPSYIQGAPFPVHPLLQPISHSFWDAGLLLIGIWLVFLLSRAPRLTAFSWFEMGICLAWGIVQAVIIEMVAVSIPDGWQYTVYSWNPALFYYNDIPITVFPLVVWFLAPVVLYAIALRYARPGS